MSPAGLWLPCSLAVLFRCFIPGELPKLPGEAPHHLSCPWKGHIWGRGWQPTWPGTLTPGRRGRAVA